MTKKLLSWRAFLLYLILIAFATATFLSFGTNWLCKLGIEQQGRKAVDAGRSIHENMGSLQNLWNIRIVAPSTGLQMISSLLVASDTRCNEVTAFDLQSGNTVWATEIGRPQGISLDVTRNRLYVVGDGPFITQLVALNIPDGKMIWWNGSQTGRRTTIFAQVSPEDQIYVYPSPIGDTMLVNPDTGEFGEIVEFIPDMYLVADRSFWQVHNAHLNAVDVQTHQAVWVSEYAKLPSCCLDQLAVIGETIFLKLSDTLLALDRQNGAFQWQVEITNMVSNFAADKDHIYILDHNAVLHVLDLLTGNPRTTIQFELPLENAKRFNDLNSIYSSWLFSDGKNLAVYWNDTDLLSVYRINF